MAKIGGSNLSANYEIMTRLNPRDQISLARVSRGFSEARDLVSNYQKYVDITTNDSYRVQEDFAAIATDGDIRRYVRDQRRQPPVSIILRTRLAAIFNEIKDFDLRTELYDFVYLTGPALKSEVGFLNGEIEFIQDDIRKLNIERENLPEDVDVEPLDEEADKLNYQLLRLASKERFIISDINEVDWSPEFRRKDPFISFSNPKTAILDFLDYRNETSVNIGQRIKSIVDSNEDIDKIFTQIIPIPGFGDSGFYFGAIFMDILYYEFYPYYVQIDFGTDAVSNGLGEGSSPADFADNSLSRRVTSLETYSKHLSLNQAISIVRKFPNVNGFVLDGIVGSALIQRPDLLYSIFGNDYFEINDIYSNLLFKVYEKFHYTGLSTPSGYMPRYMSGLFKVEQRGDRWFLIAESGDISILKQNNFTFSDNEIYDLLGRYLVYPPKQRYEIESDDDNDVGIDDYYDDDEGYQQYFDNEADANEPRGMTNIEILFPYLDALNQPVNSAVFNRAIKELDYMRVRLILNNQLGPRGNQRFDTTIDGSNWGLIDLYPGLKYILG